jgi:hypothetical protein
MRSPAEWRSWPASSFSSWRTTTRAQAAQLADGNKTLEERVQEQVAELERLGRLKRFFSPHLAELIVAGGAEDPLKTHRREVTVDAAPSGRGQPGPGARIAH